MKGPGGFVKRVVFHHARLSPLGMVFGPAMYVKAGSAIFGVYGVQMLLVPGNMQTDHFNAPNTKYTDFWIRGHAASIVTIVYCLQNMESELAAKATLLLSTAIALLYPFNAKFGYLSQLEVKCARSCPDIRCDKKNHPTCTAALRCPSIDTP